MLGSQLFCAPLKFLIILFWLSKRLLFRAYELTCLLLPPQSYVVRVWQTGCQFPTKFLVDFWEGCLGGYATTAVEQWRAIKSDWVEQTRFQLHRDLKRMLCKFKFKLKTHVWCCDHMSHGPCSGAKQWSLAVCDRHGNTKDLKAVSTKTENMQMWTQSSLISPHRLRV